MDGMAMSGTPWLEMPGMPLTLHGSRDYECTLNETSQCEYEQGYWRFWYEADHRYALPTVAFFLAVIIFFAVAFSVPKLMPHRVTRLASVRKTVAAGRYLSYKAFRLPALNWNSAPVGVLLLGAAGAVFFFSMTLGPKPYYWPNTDEVNYGDSPPIATRAGWMGLACLPFVFATAGKSNFITLVTGVSHEKLQVFHRWISYAFFVLGLIHTFPFIIHNISVGDMQDQWNTSVFYWTGVVALLAQAWLTFASISPLRSLCYEFFKLTHYLAGLVFVLFLFFHCDFTLSSWDYFIVTGVLFALSWLHSQLRVFFEHGISSRAQLSVTANGFIRVTVPTQTSWVAGQHFFVRFLSPRMQPWSSHPFTVCSLPERDAYREGKESELVFFVRPMGGFTTQLAKFATSTPEASVRVLLDGPYGGVDMSKVAQSDRTLVIAGGSGAGFALPLVECHLRRLQLLAHDKTEPAKNDRDQQLTPEIHVVLATRDKPTRAWFEKALDKLTKQYAAENASSTISIRIHYTGSPNASPKTVAGQFLQKLHLDPEKAVTKSTDASLSQTSDSDEPTTDTEQNPLKIEEFESRPNLTEIVASEAARNAHGALSIFVCGPLSMQKDVADAAAAQQLRIMKDGSKDVYLHMEHFSWA